MAVGAEAAAGPPLHTIRQHAAAPPPQFVLNGHSTTSRYADNRDWIAHEWHDRHPTDETMAGEPESTSDGLVPPAQSGAGPFGLLMGMAVHDLVALGAYESPHVTNGPVWLLSTPPKPHPRIRLLNLWVDEREFGLVRVRAHSEFCRSGENGAELRTLFFEFEAQLQMTYGRNFRREDQLLPGAFDNGDRSYLFDLWYGRRLLRSTWTRNFGSSLPSRLDCVQVYAAASTHVEGLVTLDYFSPDYPAYERRMSPGAEVL